MREVTQVALRRAGRAGRLAPTPASTPPQATQSERRPDLPDPRVRSRSGCKRGLTAERDRRRPAPARGRDPRRGHQDHPAAAGARHRHRRRLQDDRRGPQPGTTYQAAGAGRATTSPTRPTRTRRVSNAFVTFNTRTPRIYADIDRDQGRGARACPTPNVFDTLQTYLGSTFINDFNYFGHTYQVYAQADAPFRNDESAIDRAADPLGLGRDGAAGRGRQPEAHHRPLPRAALQPLSRRRDPGRRRARPLHAARRWRRWSAIAKASAARRATATNGPNWPTSRSSPATPARWSSRWRWCSSSWCWRRSTRASPCRSR